MKNGNDKDCSRFDGKTLTKAHDRASLHRKEILDSRLCGCFFCLETFVPAEIVDWKDPDMNDVCHTALCPRCGIKMRILKVPTPQK